MSFTSPSRWESTSLEKQLESIVLMNYACQLWFYLFHQFYKRTMSLYRPTCNLATFILLHVFKFDPMDLKPKIYYIQQ